MTVLPTPPQEDLADWEVRPGSELLAVDRTRKLVPYLETLRTADPGYHHVFHLNSQARLVAVERIPAAWTADQVIARVIQTSGRNGGDAIALGLDGHAVGDVLPFQRKLVADVGHGMAVAEIRFADAMMSLDDRYFSWLDAGLLKLSQSMPSSELEEDPMLEATLS